MAKSPKRNDLAAKAEPFLKRVEAIEAEKESEKGTYMERCKALNEDRKEVYVEAKDVGVNVKALKALVHQRKLEAKIKTLDADFDIDEQAQFAALALAFAGTPFGEHARARAEKAGGSEEAAPDARPDEENLARIGRGSGAELVDSLAH